MTTCNMCEVKPGIVEDVERNHLCEACFKQKWPGVIICARCGGPEPYQAIHVVGENGTETWCEACADELQANIQLVTYDIIHEEGDAEYKVVEYHDDTEYASYFTDDLDDAIVTRKAAMERGGL